MKTLPSSRFTATQTKLRVSISTILATLALSATTVHAAGVKVFVQAPFDYATGDFDLDDIETYNQLPVYTKSFAIPYGTLQQLASQMMKDNVDRTISDTVVCSDPCPDVSYSVTVASEFGFTQTGQPEVQSFGDANENGVTVKLEGVQARIKLNISVHAETWFDSANVQVPIEVLVGAHGVASAKLWPALDVPQSDVFLTLDGKNVDISGLNGKAIQLGAELGTFIGFTPLGVLVGGPIGGAILGAIGGDAAAEEAERRIKAIIANKLEGAITLANTWLKNELKQYITPNVAQANAFRDQLINKPLPGIGKSLMTLQNDWGASLDVRSNVTNNVLTTVASTRFSPAQNGGALYGRVRLPKTQCVYAEINNKIIGHYKLPMGTTEHNTDLAARVGQDCNAVLNFNDLKTSVYLGESPESQLQSGNSANDLPRWATAGLISYSGVLQDKGHYYECAFAVNGLPAVAISELGTGADLSGRITNLYPASERVLHLPIGSVTAIFNSEIQPYGSNGVILGGKGPETVEDCPAEGGGGTGWQKNPDFKSRFDPETCPQCGFQLGYGDRGEVIYSANNPEVFQGVWSVPSLNPALNNIADLVALNPQTSNTSPNIGAQTVTKNPAIFSQGINIQGINIQGLNQSLKLQRY